MILAYGYRYGAPWWRKFFPRPIELKGALSLNQHLLCFGQPGSGKSAFLYFQLEQDAKAHRPFILFDVHSDLFRQALATLIFHHWQPEDVVIIDPTDRRWGSPGINVLESNGEPYEEIVSELLGALKAIWKDAWGHRTEDLMRNTFMALCEKNLTLGESELFLTDATFRSPIVQELKNQKVKHFWQHHFAELRESEQRTFIEAPRNKLSEFLSHPALEAIFSQTTSTINFTKSMNEGKAVLVNLSRNHLKESRGLFGALLLAKLALAILSRENITLEKRVPVTLYCDEAHEYFIRDFCLLIAAAARKFQISYRVFFQSISQYQSEDVDILFATCATQVAFNLARKDAERMARELFTFSGHRFIKHQDRDVWGPKGNPTYYSIQEEQEHAITELTTQNVGECYIRIKGPDDNGNPYIATVPKVEYPTISPEQEHAFREASAAIYYTPTEKINQERQARLERFQPKPPSKITNRS